MPIFVNIKFYANKSYQAKIMNKKTKKKKKHTCFKYLIFDKIFFPNGFWFHVYIFSITIKKQGIIVHCKTVPSVAAVVV